MYDLDLLKAKVTQTVNDQEDVYTSGDATVEKLLDQLYNLRPDAWVSWKELYNLIKEEYADPEGIWED